MFFGLLPSLAVADIGPAFSGLTAGANDATFLGGDGDNDHNFQAIAKVI